MFCVQKYKSPFRFHAQPVLRTEKETDRINHLSNSDEEQRRVNNIIRKTMVKRMKEMETKRMWSALELSYAYEEFEEDIWPGAGESSNEDGMSDLREENIENCVRMAPRDGGREE